MIKLDCENYLISKTLKNYLENKKFSLASENEACFTTIKISETAKNINLFIDDIKKEISTPVDINYLMSEIFKSIVDIHIPISNYYYYPYQRLVENSKRRSLLSEIQNIILNNILLSKYGVNKDLLYQRIWKADKSIQINKLDTHLTNLKNKLNEELNLDVNFQSHEKKLRLLID